MERHHHALLACALALAACAANAADIPFRSFSDSATMGPQAQAYAQKLQSVTSTTLGSANEVRFVRLPGIPAIPSKFGGNLVTAVGAGAAGGGFDAAYTSASELNKSWGFIYNSGVPLGPTFDEFMGFLYGRSVDGSRTGLELLQSIFDANGRNVVAIPIVASSEQLSGYFPLPIGNVKGMKGIGLEGFCQQPWTLRYLPPAENVLGRACDDLVAARKIPAKNIKFIAAIPGGGSLVAGVKSGQLQGFEFATPIDDISQLFNGVDNPGTVGVRYVHLPGWQQQFLITWMLVNKQVWDGLSPAQQTLVKTVARDHVISSWGENLQVQGDALRYILSVNQGDADPSNDLVFTEWPKDDLEKLSRATIGFLNDRVYDTTLPQGDRQDLATILEALRKYVQANDFYWDHRMVPTKLRFDDWSSAGGSWTEKNHKD
jgi:TRAP-type mannitol/chloroaromatic compound transport system substrate-binding protein